MTGLLPLRRSTLVWLVAGLLLIGAAGYMLRPRANDVATSATPQPSRYAAISSGKVDVEGGLVSIAARLPGVVRTVHVQEGDRVTAGQVLAQQDDTEAALSVESARAALAQAQANLASAHVKIAAAQREYDRLVPLSEKRFVATQRLDAAEDQLRATRADVSAHQAAVATAAARLRQALNTLELTNVRAPSSGIIVRRFANPGAGASTLNVSVMFQLQPDAPRIVRAQIDEATIAQVKVGQAVEIVSETDSARVHRGQVLRLGSVFGARTLQSDDPYDRTDERVVEVVVAVHDAPLLVGQRVIVRFLPK